MVSGQTRKRGGVMRRVKKRKEATIANHSCKLWRVEGKEREGQGLNAKNTQGAAGVASFTCNLKDCYGRSPCGKLSVSGRLAGCEFDSSLFIRRIAAAPRFVRRGVFFGGYCMAYAPFMGVPGGKPSGLPFPYERSVNLPGAAHPLTGVCGSFKFSSGA